MGVVKNKQGFTIVELLIVVVVIAILAAITIVSYNGINNRAQVSAIASELNQNTKKIMSAAVEPGSFLPASVLTNGLNASKFDLSKYRTITYCANSTDFVLLVATKAGKKYYQRGGGEMVNNDSIDSFLPCPTIGVGSANTTYLNLPAPCSPENGTCTFSGTATVVYGNVPTGRFSRVLNATSPFTCNHASFGGDPASGFSKNCYVYSN
jgi:prepilin-type N-terminal cleavage/methylation domain-containing protein